MSKKSVNESQQMLFEEHRIRDTKGRFCTRDRSLYERAMSENAMLRYERDRYMRAYIAVARDNERLHRELIAVKEAVAHVV